MISFISILHGKTGCEITALFVFTPTSRICTFMFKKLWHLLTKQCLFYSLRRENVLTISYWSVIDGKSINLTFLLCCSVLFIMSTVLFWKICWILFFVLTQFYSLNCINCSSALFLRLSSISWDECRKEFGTYYFILRFFWSVSDFIFKHKTSRIWQNATTFWNTL